MTHDRRFRARPFSTRWRRAPIPDFAAEGFLGETRVSDASKLDPVIEAILAANPGQVEAYRGGKEGLLGFFVGQVMKETEGKADPRVVNERLREKLGA